MAAQAPITLMTSCLYFHSAMKAATEISA